MFGIPLLAVERRKPNDSEGALFFAHPEGVLKLNILFLELLSEETIVLFPFQPIEDQ